MNEVESISQAIIVAHFELLFVQFPGHGEGNNESCTDCRFPGRASKLSSPEFRLNQERKFIMITMYDQVNKVGIPLSGVFLSWSCSVIRRTVPGERVLIHVKHELQQIIAQYSVNHVALR